MTMALLATGKPFQNLHKTNHPPLPSPLPKPTLISPRPLSFQRHASSTTFPTVSATTDLPKSPIFSFNIVHSSSLVPSPYNRGQRFQCPRVQIEDDIPPTLNDDEWGTPRQPSIFSNGERGNDPNSGAENPQNGESNSPPGNVGGADSAGNGLVSATSVDEWGEKTVPDDESAQTRLPDTDPPSLEDDERGAASDLSPKERDGSAEDSGLSELKQCLVDCFYGTEYGLRASSQTRAEIGELISQLEAQNPTPVPTEAPSLLQGKWVLVYTSFSELLPLIAAGTLPFVKLGKIFQEIDIDKFTIENSASYSGPFATFSFRALASFEVRSPKRIEVKFEEGIIPPPEITSTLDIPEKVEIFGQKIDLTSFQGSLRPLQEAATNISRVISGQPPLKLPIRRDGAQSWLLITYLDKDLRISRGDGGGLFVLVKEGSSLLSL
uniref:Plastid lipid-associated protein/fibrillin conserved domain-containing protein n=1 Tax=Picea sitchensis TaxID=3332 RepID=B8LP15_PICSI|nr:unknown [Picea sitchensis]